MSDSLVEQAAIEEPGDYFSGIGDGTIPVPTDILLFRRETREALQQKALQNRSHHRYVLAFNIRTAGSVHVDHLVHTFSPGQALLILPYQFHHFSGLESRKLNWLFCTFELEHTTYLEPLRNRVLATSDTTRTAYETLAKIWTDGAQSKWVEANQAEQLQVALTALLLALKHDLLIQAPDLPEEPRDNLLRRINTLMAEWRGRQVSVDDLAAEFGMSTSWLRAAFKRVAGIPIGAYMQNYRINRAMALLRTTDLPIAEIAEEAGFGSPQAFSRVFKQKTDSSPRAYRRGA